jgi:hypothetical protein
MKTPVKFVAALTGVREVSLLGTADPGYWKNALAKEGLRAAERGGQAQVMVIAAAARFRGIEFREVSFSVLVDRPDDVPDHVPGPDAAYLVGAFNSRRLFAFSERVFFRTPYRHAEISTAASPDVSIRVARRGIVLFDARMGPGRTLSGVDRGWEGPVFLPGSGDGTRARSRTGSRGNYFVARISGNTMRCSFEDALDSLTITPSREDPAFAALRDSQFVPREWAVRVDAAHAKSKTYARAAPPQGVPV